MSGICKCGEAGGNLGQPNCIQIFGRTARPILVPTYDDNGDLNKIVAGDLPLNAAYFTTQVNATYSQRWQPLPKVYNYQDDREDSITEDIDGIPYPVAQGNKPVAFDLIGKTGAPQVKGQVDALKCKDMSFFLVTVDGEIVGYDPDGTKQELLPIPIQSGTLDTKFTTPRRDAKSRLTVMFMVEETFDDADLSFVSADQITDLSSLKAIIDVQLSGLTANSATELEVQANLKYFGTLSNQRPFIGATDVNDWSVYNNTTSSVVVPSGVTESPTTPGLYTITIPLQTTADDLAVSVDKEGFESETDNVAAL